MAEDKKHPFKNWLVKVSSLFSKKTFPAHEENNEAFEQDTPKDPLEPMTLSDWLKAIDGLQPLLREMQNELNTSYHMNDLDLELLGSKTYLYHVDRLLVKIKEHYLTLRYRLNQFSGLDHLNKMEFTQAHEACLRCHSTIVNLTNLFQKIPIKHLYSDETMGMIHALELESASLAAAMRTLQHFVYRQEAIAQLNELEQSLFKYRQSQGKTPYLNELSLPSPISFSEIRTDNLHAVKPEHIPLVNSIVDIHKILRKCYVVARKAVIKETLDSMGEDIQSLIASLSQSNVDKNESCQLLMNIFNGIESLRFSTNRESRCSRNLFEKAKMARTQMRKACARDLLGQETLKLIAVRRATLLKPKQGIK